MTILKLFLFYILINWVTKLSIFIFILKVVKTKLYTLVILKGFNLKPSAWVGVVNEFLQRTIFGEYRVWFLAETTFDLLSMSELVRKQKKKALICNNLSTLSQNPNYIHFLDFLDSPWHILINFDQISILWVLTLILTKFLKKSTVDFLP